jgi:hypothetical protein
MAAITAAVAVGAVAAGGAVASSMAAKSAAKKSARAMSAAYDNVEFIDINQVNNDALAADSKRFEEQFKLQEKFDPTVAALRKEGAGKLLEGLNEDAGANKLLQQLTQETAVDSPRRQAIVDKLFEQAEAELNAGATLPPEFQAELVRSGLETSGAAGVTGSGAAGVEARTLLGRAGIELQAHRQNQAANLLSTADSAKASRAAILANVLGTVENVKGQRQARQLNAYATGASGVPQAGLTGNDVANMALTNVDLKNQVTLGKGGVAANLALAKGAANQQMIGGITSAVTGVVGGMPMGGMGGGGIMNAGNGMRTPQTAPRSRGAYFEGYNFFDANGRIIA